MYEIYFYRDGRGTEPVKQYLEALAKRKAKADRTKLNKIRDYIALLKQFGLSLGEPYIKHIQGDLWELRPLRDRIFFAAYNKNGFVLLHHFVKKTNKTPKREMKIAESRYRELV